MFGRQHRLSLEITRERFRAVELRLSSKGTTLTKAFDAKRLANGAAPDDTDAASTELRELLTSNGIRASEVRVLFDIQPVSVSTISVPRANIDEVLENTQWYAEQHSPLPVDKAVISARICDTTDADAVPVILVSTDKRKVQSVIDLLAAARIKPRKMDVVPFALERLYLSQTTPDDDHATSSAIVGLGNERASVIIIHRGSPMFFRHLRIFPDTDPETLVERLRWSIQSYCDWHALNAVDPVHLCRIDDVFPKIEEQLHTALNTEVRQLDPMSGITCADNDIAAQSRGAGFNTLAALIGAAL
jgi:Tfp pilus assembly PilM family ATPase